MQKSRDQLSCRVPAVKTQNLTKKSRSGMLSRDHELSVEWSDEDQAYVGYCRDLFPYGGVCHDENRIAAYAKLVEIVEWHLQDEARTKIEITGQDVASTQHLPIEQAKCGSSQGKDR
jgi:hypothetical protein